MPSTERISPSEVRETQEETGNILLVCAYEDEEKCNKLGLDGSFSLQEFKKRFSDLPKHKQIVFYCN